MEIEFSLGEKSVLVDLGGRIDINLRSLKPLICVLFVSCQGRVPSCQPNSAAMLP